MKRVQVRAANGSYSVLVGTGLLAQLPEILEREKLQRPRSVVSNSVVGPLYARDAAAPLNTGTPFELPDGEQHKRWTQVERLCKHWLKHGFHRGDSVLAVGGGVTTDMVGFAASVYLRGISWIAAPTTLLAMVDAAVGGKTGVNLEQGKNLVGAFWPPRLVVVDVVTLITLDHRQINAGLAEVVKTAWIGDHGLLDLIGKSNPKWQEIVLRAVKVKAEVVMADERETGARKALNLGHSLGHALEAATSYRRFLHGEAVAWGLLAAAQLAARRELLSPDAHRRLAGAVNSLGPLPALNGLAPEQVLEHLARDKKADDLGVAWVLPTDEGVALDQRITADEVKEVLAGLQGRS